MEMRRFTINELHQIAKKIFLKAIEAVNPYYKIKENIHIDNNFLVIKGENGEENLFNLDNFERIFLFGTGKASCIMAKAIEEIFGERIIKGIVTTKYGHALSLNITEIIEAGHPLPDNKGLYGARKIQELLKQTGPKDLIIFLVSGGGSALLPLPPEGIKIEEKQRLTELLLLNGAEIKEINMVRKHISEIKGGWFTRWAYPSTIISFILSDVVGDHLDLIASGPTAPDPHTFKDALEVLKKYKLIDMTPGSIKAHIKLGMEGKVQDTPKPGDKIFKNVYNFLIGSNILALKEAKKEASLMGFNSLILSSSIVGNTREAAKFHGAIAREIILTGNPVSRPACIISGGETTVIVKGNGKGGRNQEFALVAAFEIEGLENVVLLCGGTDGTDGPTEAAGAISDNTTIKRAKELGLTPEIFLENNDSFHFFERLGDLFITGPTHTNVMDVRILLID